MYKQPSEAIIVEIGTVYSPIINRTIEQSKKGVDYAKDGGIAGPSL